MSETQSDIPEEHLQWIFHYGGHPLWVYLKKTLDIDILEVCPRITCEEPILKTDLGDLTIRVVDQSTNTNLSHMFNNDKTFLLNSVNTVFEFLKAGVEKDGEKILIDYKFKLDENHNMFLTNSETNGPMNPMTIAVFKID